MSKDERHRDLMGYEALQDEALRGVVRAALERVAGPQGLPGEHHFYISFRTSAPGVSIPDDLAERYPDEMTIVLQHQFWDLTPDKDGFSVTLQFGGQPKALVVPYLAVTRFYDPHVQYLLQFSPPLAAERPKPRARAETSAPVAAAPADGEAKIVSLDQFRKK
jgi:hypothetical protein